METPTIETLCCTPLFDEAIGEQDAADLAAVLKALADPVRIRLVSIIGASGEACACDFPEMLGKSQPTVSHHLSQLVNAGILEREQRGKWAWFSVNQARVDEVRAVLG